MSRGIGTFAHKVAEDNETVIYQYGNYNLNDAVYRNEEHIEDGLITIDKDCFHEPDIHEKIKKMPSGKKKLVIKRIPKETDYPEMIREGRIIVENSNGCWQTFDDGVDVMVSHLLYCIFYKYQEVGNIPERLSLNY